MWGDEYLGGYHEYRRGVQYIGGIMIHVGDIMMHVGISLVPWRVFSTMGLS